MLRIGFAYSFVLLVDNIDGNRQQRTKKNGAQQSQADAKA